MFTNAFYIEWNELHLNEKIEFANKLVSKYSKRIEPIFDEIKDNCPELVLLMYYKDPSKKDLCLTIAINNIYLFKDHELFKKIMYETTWKDELINNYAEQLISLNEDNIFYIIQHLLENDKIDIIKRFALSTNLDIRGKAMIDLFLEYEELFDEIYNQPLVTYLKSNNMIMKEKYVSELCYYMSYLKPEEYQELRDFILDNYEANDLAYYMIKGIPNEIDDRTKEDKELQLELLKERINDIYRKSISGKLDIYLKYADQDILDKDILQELRDKILPFLNINSEDMIDILSTNLLNELIHMFDKHFQRATGAKEITYAGYGTTAQVFRVDDKVIKFCRCKLNKGKTQSISSYLIAPIIDSAYTYHNGQDIEYGIEIQKYYSRPLNAREIKTYNQYEKAFRESGLECEDLDYIMNEEYQNLRYLDDYHDADYPNPELLPDWFKSSPVVLIDSDLVKRKK